MRNLVRLCGLLFSLWTAAAVTASEADVSREDAAFYRNHVKPILVRHCFTCHGGQAEVKGGLRLSNRADLLKGGDSGPAIELDAPDQSLLLDAINYASLEMPPKGKLAEAELEVLTRWVKKGAPFDPKEEIRAVAGDGHAPQVTEEAKKFWAFQPVRAPVIPDLPPSGWIRSPIDAFLLDKLNEEGLKPAAPAEKYALLRRATYDLIGLPPTPEEVEAFLADDSPQAFERVVDRLLDSPHYGERWARHWLDLVRYAETNSFERDGAKPFVWQYRDYVIRSFNDDKPYDQFLREQLAGDELDEVTPDTIVATGYYRIGQWDDEPSDPVQALYDDLDDILTTTSQVMLGLTINCARCHDHKLDPIPQRDYYAMLAFFRNVRRYGVRSHESVLASSVRVIASPERQAEHQQRVEDHRKALEALTAQLSRLEAKVVPTFSDVEKEEFKHKPNRIPLVKKRPADVISPEEVEEYVRLTRERERLERSPPEGLEQALCVTEEGSQCAPTHLLIRGNPHAPGDLVEPGFPSVLSPPEPTIAARSDSAGRRRALAEWITSPDNPLTARVMVNRLWHYHFGRGLVRSTSNFGTIGDRPTHPELLDWLASEFVRRGWRLKDMHRLIMLSSTYQMSSAASAEGLARDPENNWFWRFDMRRLTAEEIRDSILAVNGDLNLSRIGGPSFYPIIPQEVLHSQSRPGAGWGTSPPEELARRSIYIHLKRSLITPIIASFDAADVDASCPVRFTTTIPTQALSMLNGDFVQRETTTFAALAKRSAEATPDRVRFILQQVTQREPDAAEIERGIKLIERLQQDGLTADEALRNYCLVALNLNEFIYLD